MNKTAHRQKILDAIPAAQARLGVEWVHRNDLKQHIGRAANAGGIRMMINEGILVERYEGEAGWKIKMG